MAEPLRIGKYELTGRLSSGGMATTWRATMAGPMGVVKPVVLKMIHPHLAQEPEFVQMFIQEARLSASLSHGNIAQVFDFGEVDGNYFIAMELIDGQSLRQVLTRAQRMGMPQLAEPLAMLITVGVCEALYYAHQRTGPEGQPLNLVHRDVSPENVLLSWQGEVKLVDFGIAKTALSNGYTKAGEAKGKPHYFSPEQAGAAELDGRSDIYSAAVMLYEMVCGRRPYEGEDIHVVMGILKGEYPAPRTLNPRLGAELEEVLVKGLALSVDERFVNARQLAERLNRLLHESWPGIQPSDLESLMSMLFEADLKAEGRPAPIRHGFRELHEQTQRPRKYIDDAPTEQTRRDEVLTEVGPPPTANLRATPAPVKNRDDETALLNLRSPPQRAPAFPTARVVLVAAGVLVMVALLVLSLRVLFGGEVATSTLVGLTSTPDGAKVVVDGTEAGQTPIELKLSHGNHTIALVRDGHRPWTKLLTVAGVQRLQVDAQLERLEDLNVQPPEPPVVDAGVKTDHFATARRASHTLGVPAYSEKLDPGVTYHVRTAGAIDLGRRGKATTVAYALEGKRVSPGSRFGVLSRTPVTIRGASRLTAWVFDDDASDNRGRLSIIYRISQYVPERVTSFDAADDALVLGEDNAVVISGLDAEREYRLVLRPDRAPRVAKEPGVLCVGIAASGEPAPAMMILPFAYTGELKELAGLACVLAPTPSKAATISSVEIDLEAVR